MSPLLPLSFLLLLSFFALRSCFASCGARSSGVHLLSADFEAEIHRPELDEAGRARVLCDYLAGMTDGFASRVYKRLFDADFGSIVDLV